MLKDLNDAAFALASFMSDLSEAATCAGWMDGLEYALWNALVGGPRSYGWIELTDDQLDRLRTLSNAAGGWVVFDDEEEEALVPLDEWKQRFAAWTVR